jgi:hypothetical protein
VGEGYEEDGEPQPHSWNKVLLDGEWYATDLTWDDPVSSIGSDYIRYDYFALTDEQMNKNHTADENKYLNYPACTSENADYFKRSGFYAENAEEAPAVMERAVEYAMENGEKYARISFADTDTFNSAVKEIFEDDYDGNPMIFAILNKYAQLYPDWGYDCSGYSIIKNVSTLTVTVKLKQYEG